MASTTQQFVFRSRVYLPRDYRDIERIALTSLRGVELEQFVDDDAPAIQSGALLCLVASPVNWLYGQFVSEGPPIGFIAIDPHNERVYVSSLAVLKDHRRRGVGAHLLGHAKSKLRGSRLAVWSYVNERNVPMQQLLKSEGFLCTEIKPGNPDDSYLFQFRRGIEDVAMARRHQQ